MSNSGYYECLCTRYYTGIHCEFMGLAVTPGTGRPTAVTTTKPSLAPECIANQCAYKAVNNQCDVSVVQFFSIVLAWNA